MKLIAGYLYFVSDDFFEKINDPYLKINYTDTKRPHYFAIKDDKTGLTWLVPCSSKVAKFEKIIENKKLNNKPTHTIKMVNIQGKKTVLLFQDMFPIGEKYIGDMYTRNSQPMCITNLKLIHELEKNAKKVINMIKRGIKFTPTQPDLLRIENILLNEKKYDLEKPIENEIEELEL